MPSFTASTALEPADVGITERIPIDVAFATLGAQAQRA
jgi:hypothetical protein